MKKVGILVLLLISLFCLMTLLTGCEDIPSENPSLDGTNSGNVSENGTDSGTVEKLIYEDWKITKAPTCTEPGVETRVCKNDATKTQIREIPKLGHTEVIDKAVEPTCTKAGLTEGKHCSICNKIFNKQEEIAALGHTDVVDQAKAPNCTETGLTEGKHCLVCDEILIKQEIINALGHTEVIDAGVAPTCTEAGISDGKHCSVCNAVIIAQEVVPARHTEVIDVAILPTCTEDGLSEGKHCSVCNIIIIAQEVIPAKHIIVIDEAVTATCTRSGLTEGSHCSVCKTIFVAQEVIPAGHIEVVDEAREPSCTETGLTEGKHCSVCKNILVAQEIIPAKGHTEGEWITDVELTCTVNGERHQVCSICNATIWYQTIFASGHSYESFITAPTCISNGKTNLVCSECGSTSDSDWSPIEFDVFYTSYCNSSGTYYYWVNIRNLRGGKIEYQNGEKISNTYTVEIFHPQTSSVLYSGSILESDTVPCTYYSWVKEYSYYEITVSDGYSTYKYTTNYFNQTPVDQHNVRTNHVEVIDLGIAPTCTKDGLTEGKHCSLCNTVIIAQEVDPARHTEEIDQAVSPTCMKDGLTEGKHCSVCNAVIVAQEVIPARHNIVVDLAVTPTCTESGLTEGSHCSLCNTIIVSQESIPAQGHVEVIDNAVTATCMKAGKTEGKHCSICNAILLKQEIIPALAHTEVVDHGRMPTCTEEGLTDGKHCSVCNSCLVEQEVIPATGHQYHITYNAATCIKPAYATYICTVCGDQYEEDIQPIVAHIYKRASSSINGYYYSVTYAVNATGGCGELQYKYELLSSQTNSTVLLEQDYSAETLFGFKSEYSLNRRVLRITIKDSVGNIVKYAVLIEDDSYTVESSTSDKAPHQYVDVVTPPTRTEQGYTTHTCAVCGDSYIDSYIPATGSVGLKYSVNSDGTTCTITGIGTCADTEIIILEFIDGFKVTIIGNSAFNGCSGLTSIVIPDSVTTIGDFAFEFCDSLTSIVIPDSVTTIGIFAFSFCGSLTSIEIPGGVTTIGSSAFEYCVSLTSIVIPDSVTTIGDSAFRFCRSLTNIVIPNSVMSIASLVFDECSNLKYNEYDNGYYLGNASNPYVVLVMTKGKLIKSCKIHESTKIICSTAFFGCDSLTSIVIPNSVVTIGDSAFGDCVSLTRIVIPDAVMNIGSCAFYECNRLTSITIGISVTSIGSQAFYGCSGLTSVVIPDSVTSISFGTFRGCDKLECVTIGNGVTSIGSQVFSGCSSLTSIVIPDSVTSIRSSAFEYCSNLTNINFKGTKAQWAAISKDSEWDRINWYTIHCTDGNITLTLEEILKLYPALVAFDSPMNLYVSTKSSNAEVNQAIVYGIPSQATSVEGDFLYDLAYLDSKTAVTAYAFGKISSIGSSNVREELIWCLIETEEGGFGFIIYSYLTANADGSPSPIPVSIDQLVNVYGFSKLWSSVSMKTNKETGIMNHPDRNAQITTVPAKTTLQVFASGSTEDDLHWYVVEYNGNYYFVLQGDLSFI